MALVCIVFLLHARSALVAVFTLPTAILMAFIVMRVQGLNANIMSLGGIAIAIGAMVDAAIIMIENAHKHLERERETRLQRADDALGGHSRRRHRKWGRRSSGRSSSLRFRLFRCLRSKRRRAASSGRSRLQKPIPWPPPPCLPSPSSRCSWGIFIRGKMRPEHAQSDQPVSYRSIIRLSSSCCKRPVLVLIAAVVAIVALTVLPFTRLGSEFMPPL